MSEVGKFAMWLGAVAFAVFLFFALSGVGRNIAKHVKSSVVGLDRHITLYASDGRVIREWTTRTKTEDKGGTIYFLDAGGKAVTVSGTFVVEER